MNNIGLFFLCFAVCTSLFAEQNPQVNDLLSGLSASKRILQTKKIEYDPLIVVVIMIKDEALVIEKTLRPYFNANIQHYLILDTGSTDNTIAVVQKLFNDNNIQHGVIKEQPFVDFATSRNCALKHARETFPNACFMLMPDAEWIMQDVPGLLKFCQEHQHESYGCYKTRNILWGIDEKTYQPVKHSDYPTDRLIRCKSNAWFHSPIHEYIVADFCEERMPDSVCFNWHNSRQGHEKSFKRFSRDVNILRNQIEQNPADQRAVFYLAQTYECLGDLDNAAIYYEKCSNMGGWDEEIFMARYRLGRVNQAQDKWDQALFNYLTAYSLRPHRIEPLIAIARYYMDKDLFAPAFLFASRAVEAVYPKTDKLFVEKNVYEYERYDILARSAWYLKEYELGERAAELALIGAPNEIRRENAHQNYSYYLNLKKH